jgi:hypothetical protein
VADGAGVSFATHICDAEVDPETGRTSKVVRYTVIQDAGKAMHPTYVEGQYQGGAAQGIGWALNEEYIYGKDGRLQNAGFLDYRIPVCSDLPMIDTQILEIPNPNHPMGCAAWAKPRSCRRSAPSPTPSRTPRRAHDPHPDVAAARAQGTQGGRSVRQRAERPSFKSMPRPSANSSASWKRPIPAWRPTSRAVWPSRSTGRFSGITGRRNCRRARRFICCRGFRAGNFQ